MNQSKSFKEIVVHTEAIAKKIQNFEQRPWNAEGLVIELTKQVGDLAARLMVFEKYYTKERETNIKYATTKEKIADELGDIFFIIVRLANHYGVDLEKAVLDTNEETRRYIKELSDSKNRQGI